MALFLSQIGWINVYAPSDSVIISGCVFCHFPLQCACCVCVAFGSSFLPGSFVLPLVLLTHARFETAFFFCPGHCPHPPPHFLLSPVLNGTAIVTECFLDGYDEVKNISLW